MLSLKKSAAALALIAAANTACAENYNLLPFNFAVWGDMPYAKAGETKSQQIPNLIDDINLANPSFTVFLGDIKDGSSRCDNIEYSNAISRFNSFKKPMVYIPGDNEWTDCHRTNNGSYNPMERLSYIRQVMYPTAESFGQYTMTLEHQGAIGAAYVENQRWAYGAVEFVALNIPGSNNNKINDGECPDSKSKRTTADCAADNAEYAARDAQNLAFLKASFQKARDGGARGLVVAIQADPGFDLIETESVDESKLPLYTGYANFLNTLVAETKNFSGEVLLIHGDTHFFKLDKPWVNGGNMLKNFTRLEAFGSPGVHWVRVTVNPKNRSLFTIEPMIISAN